MIKLEYDKSFLSIDGYKVDCECQIKEAFALEDIIIVLFDPNAKKGKIKKFKNLTAYDKRGQHLWDADLPHHLLAYDAELRKKLKKGEHIPPDDRPDCYWKIVRKAPLVVSSFSSYECEIDLKNGKILEANFYK